MPTHDLREWIALLEREGELVRVPAEVDPHLEMTEIVDRDGARRRPRAALRAPEGRTAPAADQPVRHRAAHVPRVRRRAARRRRGQARRRARDAAARGARREGARAEDAEVDRGLAAEGGEARRLPGGRAARRRRRPRPAAGADVLAGRRRPVHHPAGRDHARSAHRPAQRRHVPAAGARPADDRDALAAAQGRPRRLPLQRGPDGGRGRARPRPDHRLLGERAAAEAHRRVHGRRLPARRAARAREGRHGRPRGARGRRDRARGLRRQGRAHRRGPVRRPHRLLHAGRAVPGLPRHGDDDAAATRSIRRSSSASRRRRTRGSARRPSGSSCRPCG